MLLLGATVALSSLVSLLDFFGLLDGIPWLNDRIPTLTLLAVGLVAGYIISERRTQLESMHTDLSKGIQTILNTNKESAHLVIEALQGVEVRRFDSVHAVLQYTNERLRQARVQIDDLSWHAIMSPDDRFEQTRVESEKHWELTGKIANRMPYREVFIFNRRGRIDKFKLRIDENAPGYQCAYYEKTNVPLIQFMIIDKQEVVVLSGEYPYLAIQDPRLVNLFMKYYEDIWEKATKLKDVRGVYWKEVERLLAHFETRERLNGRRPPTGL
jgi:hypothetical protein